MSAEVLPMPRPADAGDPLPMLSDARELLRHAITRRAAAATALDAASQRCARLEAIKAQAAALDLAIAASRAFDAEALGKWLTKPPFGARPGTSSETQHLLEQRLAIAADLEGVAAIGPAENEKLAAAARTATEALALVVATSLDVVVEALGGILEAELVPALIGVRRVETRVASVLHELQRRADQGETPCAKAVELILRMLRGARQAAGAAPLVDDNFGPDLLERLMVDPSAA